ncbi:MAG TPA: phage tail sheath subtilisin-like domain-containing protein [Gaiellaceae bacterium]|nr:phage tail sheath subtilisin-like domain-containing protein [Gaiellaceae bacterium]
MPEYLSPGVYVEEVSFRSSSIQGVPTSTTGFVGMTRTGPVRWSNLTSHGPATNEPRLVTSFTEFERVYGGLESIWVNDGSGSLTERRSFVAHAARAFFMNGGQRLYVSRVFEALQVEGEDEDWGVASRTLAVPGGGTVSWRARWPGAFGNVFVSTSVVRTRNVAYAGATGPQAQSAKQGAVVEVIPNGTTPPKDNDAVNPAQLYVVSIDANGVQSFMRGGTPQPIAADAVIQIIQLQVMVVVDDDRTDVYTQLAPSSAQTRNIGKILQQDHPEDEDAVVWLDWDEDAAGPDAPAKLVAVLQGDQNGRLAGGHDGMMIATSSIDGLDADLDDITKPATGLYALDEIDDIAIIAAPDAGTYDDTTECAVAAGYLISHAENQRYRIAVIDGPQGSSMNDIRAFRGQFDSKYAALYHPWIEILDPLARPTQGAPPPRIVLPPSGFVTGIYARSDINRGVWKAPANEVVQGLTKFEANINKGRQDVLNPEGINALRFFEGRGNRVWGARTMSSDPEWQYVNVRRLFIYLEHSIDKSTQWAVFEPNNERLWTNIQHTVEDFLLVQWRAGALVGTKPEEAYFVRCDRTTMTQNDLDNGRLICLIGVAPVYPAEFVIFRIGQWTADASLT